MEMDVKEITSAQKITTGPNQNLHVINAIYQDIMPEIVLTSVVSEPDFHQIPTKYK